MFPKYAKWQYVFLVWFYLYYHLRRVLLDRVIHFGETLVVEVKGPSPQKLELLIKVPNVVHVKVHVFGFNMILLSSP